MFIGPTKVPSQFAETIKILNSHYEFGANFVDPNVMLIGRVLIDGRLNARVKWDLTDNLTVKANAQVNSVFIYSLSFGFLVCRQNIWFSICKLVDNFIVFLFQLTNEPHMSHSMVNFDYKVSHS